MRVERALVGLLCIAAMAASRLWWPIGLQPAARQSLDGTGPRRRRSRSRRDSAGRQPVRDVRRRGRSLRRRTGRRTSAADTATATTARPTNPAQCRPRAPMMADNRPIDATDRQQRRRASRLLRLAVGCGDACAAAAAAHGRRLCVRRRLHGRHAAAMAAAQRPCYGGLCGCACGGAGCGLCSGGALCAVAGPTAWSRTSPRPRSIEAGGGGAMMGPATSQIAFLGEEGVQVSWDVSGSGMFDCTPLVIPGRQDFYQGAIYRLKLTNIPGRPGVELYPDARRSRRSRRGPMPTWRTRRFRCSSPKKISTRCSAATLSPR